MKKELDKPLEETGRDVVESAEKQRALAEVQAAFTVAFKNPRDETKARNSLDKTVERVAFAESAFYSYPRGRTEIFGPSINLAREIARLWGNFSYGFRILHDTEEERTLEGYAWDMESNVHVTSPASFKKLIQRRVSDGKGGYLKGADDKYLTRWIPPDERDLRELTERHAAIQMRNCILRLMPRDVVDYLAQKAREVVKKGISTKDIKQRRVETVKVFEVLGVYENKLNDYCKTHFGHNVDKITPDEITELGGVWNAIKEGNASREDYFGTTTPIKPAPGPEPGEIQMKDIPTVTPGPPQPPVTKTGEDPGPTPPPPEPEQPSLSPAEQEAQNELHVHTKEILVVMTQRHRKEFKPPKDYSVILNTALAFGDDVKSKITYLSKELEVIGVNVDKEYQEIEAQKSKAEGKM